MQEHLAYLASERPAVYRKPTQKTDRAAEQRTVNRSSIKNHHLRTKSLPLLSSLNFELECVVQSRKFKVQRNLH